MLSSNFKVLERRVMNIREEIKREIGKDRKKFLREEKFKREKSVKV